MEHLSKIKHKRIQIQISNYLFQIRQLHMVLFKLEMIQANNKLFYTEKKISCFDYVLHKICLILKLV